MGIKALTFVVGATLGYGLATPARSLGALMAGVSHGPKAVDAIFAAPTRAMSRS